VCVCVCGVCVCVCVSCTMAMLPGRLMPPTLCVCAVLTALGAASVTSVKADSFVSKDVR